MLSPLVSPCIRGLQVFLLAFISFWANQGRAETLSSNPGFQYRPETISKIETLQIEIEAVQAELRTLRKSSSEGRPTITPDVRNRLVDTFHRYGLLMDEMGSQVREYASGKNWIECDRTLPELQQKRQKLTGQWNRLALKPLNTEREKLSAASAAHGQIVSALSVVGGFASIPMSCHFETMAREAKRSGLPSD